MNILKRIPWISTALLVTLLTGVGTAAEAKTTASISSAPGVSTTKEGADPATLLSSDAAKAPIESRLQWVSACGEVPAGETKSYTALLDVDASGSVTAVTRVGSTVDDSVGACIDGVLKEAKFPALSAPDATVKVTVSLSLEGEKVPDPVVAGPAVVPLTPKTATPGAPEATGDLAGGTAESSAAAPATAGPVDPGATAPAAGATAQDPGNAAELRAANAEPVLSDAKPWRVAASLSLAAGTGVFLRDVDNPTTLNAGVPNFLESASSGSRYVGYAMSFSFSYKLSDLLRASLAMAVDQQLTLTNQDSGDSGRIFYFRETSLGVGTSNLWKDEAYTGIGVDVSARAFFPTDASAIAAGRVMGFSGGVVLRRSFSEVGPGTLSFSYGLSVRGNLGSAQRDGNPFRGYRGVTTAGEISGFAAGINDPVAAQSNDGTGGLNTMSSISNRIGIAYSFLDDFTLGLEYGLNNGFQRDGTDTDEPIPGVGTSINATGGGGQTDSFQTQIYLAYQLNDYVGLSGGLSTSGDPRIFSGDGYYVRFPFFDVQEPENNLSTVFLSVDFSY